MQEDQAYVSAFDVRDKCSYGPGDGTCQGAPAELVAVAHVEHGQLHIQILQLCEEHASEFKRVFPPRPRAQA